MQLCWFLLLAMSQAPALIASDSQNASNPSTTTPNTARIAANFKTCQMDPSNCACAWSASTRPPGQIGYCIEDPVTCQCGWDDGTGNFVRVGSGQPVAAGKTCVVDGQNCKCLAGYLPLPPAEVEATTQTVENLITYVTAQMNEVKLALVQLIPQIRHEVVDKPDGAMPALSVEQREKLIAEPIWAMTLLKDVAGDANGFERLALSERQALVARLRAEVEYLGKLRGDKEFMAAQLGKMADGEQQPMVQRLRAVLAELLEAKRKAAGVSG